MDVIIKKEEDQNFYCDDSDHPIIYCEKNIMDGKTNTSNVVTLIVDPNAMCIKEEPCTEESEFGIEYLHTEVKEELPVKSEDIEIKPEEIGESSVTDCEKEKNHNLITSKRKKDGPTVFRCTLCQYTTTERQAHWQHQDSHKDATDQMYYKCHHCDHRTTQKTALKLHLLTHMDPTKVTWYKCTLCPYASKLKGGLKVHMLTHKNISEVASDTKRTVEVMQQVKLQQKRKRIFSKLPESETECDDDIVLVRVENIDGKDSTVDNTVCDFTENKSVENENDRNVSIIDKEACDFADILLRKNGKEENRCRKRFTRCKFCNKDILATNFSRHVQRCHAAEEEIKNILRYPKNSKQRKVAFLLLRNDTNFNLYMNGVTRPNRWRSNESNRDKKNYHPCARCKGLYIKKYLRRHSRICTIKLNNVFQNRKNDVDNPQTAVPTRKSSARSVTSKLNVASDTKRTVEVMQRVKLQQKRKRIFSKLPETETECDNDIVLVRVENIDGKDISTVDNTVCDFTENKSVQNENDKNVSIIDKEACDFADILLRKNGKEENRCRKRFTRCKFCNKDILATNFSRHVQRCHAAEEEIKNILRYPKNSKQRKVAFLLLRNDTNFNLYMNGVTRPNRWRSNKSNTDKKNYHPCARCKGLYIKKYLRRHSQICTIKMKNVFQSRKDDLDNPQIAVPARESSAGSVTSKLNIFSSSECKKTASKVTKDALISHFGESYLEKQKEDVAYACDNRMKELNRLLTTYQRTSGNNKASLKDLLLPSKFSTVVSTVNKLAGYNPQKKTCRTPNLVDNLENSLKQACKELIRLIEEESDGFKTHSVVAKEKWLKDVKNFINLVNTRWKAELESLTNKEPQRRICTRSLKLPLANSKAFEEESLTIAAGEVPTPDKRKQPLTNMTGKIVKRRWTNEDVEHLNKEFGRYIKKGVYPSGKEIEVFIKKYKVNRNIDVVKSKIQHIINLNNKRKLMKQS